MLPSFNVVFIKLFVFSSFFFLSAQIAASPAKENRTTWSAKASISSIPGGPSTALPSFVVLFPFRDDRIDTLVYDAYYTELNICVRDL